MCIVLVSTAHPDYALIVISNRDVQPAPTAGTDHRLNVFKEYLNRPTAAAAWWAAPNEHVLGGRDLYRDVQGTWLGVTSDGRIAALTNFREDNAAAVEGVISRGAMVNAFLTQKPGCSAPTEEFVKSLVKGEGVRGAGGFSLICGKLGEPLAIVSNRTPSVEGVTWIASKRGETVGLSNEAFADRSWPKVLHGEQLMAAAIEENLKEKGTQDELVAKLMNVLTTDTLPVRQADVGWETFINQLKNSIFIPVLGGEGTEEKKAEEIATSESEAPLQLETHGYYGTQKQTVILVDHSGKITFVERSLFDKDESHLHESNPRDRAFEFEVSGSKTVSVN